MASSAPGEGQETMDKFVVQGVMHWQAAATAAVTAVLCTSSVKVTTRTERYDKDKRSSVDCGVIPGVSLSVHVQQIPVSRDRSLDPLLCFLLPECASLHSAALIASGKHLTKTVSCVL